MAFGVSSKVFVATIEYQFEAGSIDTTSDTFKIALYNDTGTPDEEVALANTVYSVDQWVVGNEVDDGAEWPATGQALDSFTSTITTNVFKLDAANEVSDGTSATLADVRGCLIYDDTVGEADMKGIPTLDYDNDAPAVRAVAELKDYLVDRYKP